MLKALKPMANAASGKGQRYEIMDNVVRGMGIRVSEAGVKTFVLITRFPGHRTPTRRSLGEYPTVSLEQARDKARRWIELVKRGIDPAVEEERQQAAELRKQAATFGVVAERFIAEKLSTERRGRDSELQIRNEFIPRWNTRPLTEITRADVKQVITEVKARAPYMARALLVTVRRLFNWAIDQGDYGLEHSPCDHLKVKSLIGELKSRTRHLSDGEIRVFVHACEQLGYPHGDLARALLLTATRHHEMAEAPWTEFDLAKGTWTIDPKRFKSNSEHIVPLTPDMMALLEGLPRFKSGPFLFTTTYGRKPADIGEGVKAKIDALMLAKLRERDPGAELKPWVVHDLRRTVRTHLAALRVPDHIAEMCLGHGKKGLQRVYDQHQYEAEMREALERWSARLRAIVSPPPANVVPMPERRPEAMPARSA
jgi:integrase